MDTQANTNNTTVQGNSSSNKNMLFVSIASLLAGVSLFFMLRKKKINYQNGNIISPDTPIIPANFNPNDVKVQLVGFRIHKIGFTGIEVSVDARVANTSNYNLSIDNLNGEFYHLGKNGSNFLTSTQRIKPLSIEKHQTKIIENIRFVVPAVSLFSVIRERMRGYNRFFIKIVIDINGNSLVVQKQVTI